MELPIRVKFAFRAAVFIVNSIRQDKQPKPMATMTTPLWQDVIKSRMTGAAVDQEVYRDMVDQCKAREAAAQQLMR